MDDMNVQEMAAQKLASAAEMLEKVLAKIDAQYESLNAKVDRIVAAVEKVAEEESADVTQVSGAQDAERNLGHPTKAEKKIAELEKRNRDLQAQAERSMRKTMSPVVTAILAKGGVSEESYSVDLIERVLEPLSVEQRIAVKAEMARAGLLQ
jgi:enoyl reductase-like protein